MSTQLFAAIREDSKYSHQQPVQLPFPVVIADTTDAYRVHGNGDSYRLEDVHLYVKASGNFRPISGEGAL